LNIGTTNLKSMLFDDKLDIISEDYIEYNLLYVENGAVEQSPPDSNGILFYLYFWN
jgi:glycerol kinase